MPSSSTLSARWVRGRPREAEPRSDPHRDRRAGAAAPPRSRAPSPHLERAHLPAVQRAAHDRHDGPAGPDRGRAAPHGHRPGRDPPGGEPRRGGPRGAAHRTPGTGEPCSSPSRRRADAGRVPCDAISSRPPASSSSRSRPSDGRAGVGAGGAPGPAPRSIQRAADGDRVSRCRCGRARDELSMSVIPELASPRRAAQAPRHDHEHEDATGRRRDEGERRAERLRHDRRRRDRRAAPSRRRR
jgi:hypothetical protein